MQSQSSQAQQAQVTEDSRLVQLFNALSKQVSSTYLAISTIWHSHRLALRQPEYTAARSSGPGIHIASFSLSLCEQISVIFHESRRRQMAATSTVSPVARDQACFTLPSAPSASKTAWHRRPMLRRASSMAHGPRSGTGRLARACHESSGCSGWT